MSITHNSVSNYKIYYLTQEQYDMLATTGSITVDGQTIQYDANAEYRTPDTSTGNSLVTISGMTPTITAEANTRYVCGEVTTLSFTPPASGVCDVIFASGTTATVLTVPSTVKWANGFDPTSLDANTTYELNICDGLGVAVSWT